jgi:SAM-dependent methyltransferase
LRVLDGTREIKQPEIPTVSKRGLNMSAIGLPMEQIKTFMRAAWMAGDFGVVAKTITGGAEAFVDGLEIPAGARVLDIACGTGNTAIPLAKRGAVVTGVDIAPNLIVQARERAAAESLVVQFDEGDAEQLPYADGSFDVVTTMFGAMFAPRPEVVASEIARVLKSGGLLAMGNWNPASFTGQMFTVSNVHAPAPPGIPPSVLWGDEGTVRERLGSDFVEIKTEIVPLEFNLPTSPAGAVAFFRKYFGPTQVAFNRLDESGRAALSADLEALWTSANVSPHPENHTLIHNEYLRITAIRR